MNSYQHTSRVNKEIEKLVLKKIFSDHEEDLEDNINDEDVMT